MSRRVYLLLLAFPFVLFASTILGKRALFWGTPLNQFIPWWTLSWDLIRTGVFPIWNTLLGMGAPLAANYQSALFYPPTWIYFTLNSIGGIGVMAWSLAIVVVLHLFWGALGMALLIRALKLSRLAQIIGGLAFGLCGYLVARAGFLSINAAAAWLPWIILGTTLLVNFIKEEAHAGMPDNQGKKSRRSKILSGFILLVLAVTMQLLAGHAQTAWYTLLLAVLWFVFLALIDPWLEKKRSAFKTPYVAAHNGSPGEDNENGGPQTPQSRRKIWLVILFGTAIVLAAGIAAVQLLPTAEYLLESQRSAAVDYEFAMSYSFWPWRFLSFLAPGLFGNPAVGDYWGYANFWEDAVYIGLIPFILAITALFTRGKKLPDGTMVNSRLIWFFGLLILGTFLIALGRNTPIFPWLYRYVPTFDMFQAPTRISILAIFALSILAAVGVDSWTRPQNRQLYWTRLGVMAAVAITIGAGLALLLTRNLSFDIRPSFIRSAAWLGLWGVCLGILALKAPEGEKDRSSNADWGWWQWAVAVVVGLDLVIAGWGLNPSVPIEVYTDPSPTAAEVKEKIGKGRIFLGSEDEELLKFERFLRFDTFMPFDDSEDWHSLRASLLPNIGVLDGIPSVNNFDPLIPGRYSAWMNLLGEANPNLKDQMLNLMGVTVVESIDLSEPYGVRFDSRQAFTRIRWVGCGIQVDDSQAALEMIRAGSIDHKAQVLLETEVFEKPPICSDQLQAELQVQEESSNVISTKVHSQAAGYLVVADVWYPGWQAYVDGERAPLLRANYLFKAIPIPAGEHEVAVLYQPKAFNLGAAVSIAAIILLIGLVAIRIRDRSSTS
jgi:hypothetical protein